MQTNVHSTTIHKSKSWKNNTNVHTQMDGSVVSANPGTQSSPKTEGLAPAATWTELEDACSATEATHRGQILLQGPAVDEFTGAEGWGRSCSMEAGLLFGQMSGGAGGGWWGRPHSNVTLADGENGRVHVYGYFTRKPTNQVRG